MVSIPFFGKGKKQSRGEVYIGIFFKEQDGVVMYLEDGHSGLKILGTEHFNYSNGWENLVDDIDEVLYRLETRTHLAPQKAIFFIYSHLVDPDNHEIKRPFLSKIKELAKSLDLKPLGYIECQEAIVEHIKSREHAPLHMVLLEFDRTVVTATLYQGGTSVHQATVARSGDVVNTLSPLFQELKQKFVLPNRLILYDEKSLTNDVSTILANRWDEEIFATPPKIDILSQEDLHKSLVDVFAKQIHAAATPGESQEAVSAAAPPAAAVLADDHAIGEETGFTFSDEPPQHAQHSQNEVMGFTIGDEEQVEDAAESTGKKRIGNPLARMKMPKLTMPPLGKTGPLMAGAAVVILALALGAGEYFLHKAEVKVTFPAEEVGKDITIDNSLKLDEGSDSRQVSETAQATGQKQIGDKAKGSITIYNSDLTGSQTLAKGTKLTGPNNLAFVLDNEVKVASASGDASEIKSSTAKVNATAAEIGTEYNIGAGAKLTIQGESSGTVIAKNESAFSGGSKKQVKVVSANDITKLRAKILDNAKKSTAETLKTKIGPGNVIVQDLTDVSLEDEKLSKKAGDEAESVTLSGDVKTTYYTYDKSKLTDAFKKELGKGLSGGRKIQPETIGFRIIKLEGRDDPETRQVVFKVRAKAVPMFDRASLSKQIAGKRVSNLDKIVKDGFRATDAEVTMFPRIPPFTVFTPFVKKNIALDIVYQ